MADFKEQTNSLMVRVIPIYLAAELLCSNLFWEWKDQCDAGRGAADGSRLHLSCEVVQGVFSAADLIAAQLDRSNAEEVYGMIPNRDRLCHKAN